MDLMPILHHHFTDNFLWYIIMAIFMAINHLVLSQPVDVGSQPQIIRASYDGDIMLGAIFPIHSFDDETRRCDKIQGQDGIQLLEAMMFALDEINSRPDFLPGFTLGALAADSCDSDTIALERSAEFVKDLTESLSFPGKNQLHCEDGSTPVRTGVGLHLDRVVGVVAEAASSISTQLASFLRLFKMPQVSYLSTTPDLSNKDRYAFFLRTVPSDTYQARAIIQILRRFSWTYVSAVYDDSTYGSSGFGEVEKLAKQYGICFAVIRKIRRHLTSKEEDRVHEMDGVVRDILKKPNAKVVVVFSNYIQARHLFEASKRNAGTDSLVWIGSDGWSGRDAVVHGVEEVVSEAITVQPLARKLEGFDEYFTSLRPSTNDRNPWFSEYWASHFECIWPNKQTITNSTSTDGGPSKCDENNTLSAENGYHQFLALYFVQDAIFVYAHALKRMHADRCGNTSGLCPQMAPANITGLDLLGYLENVTFTDSNLMDFYFLNGVDGPPRYSILNYRKILTGDIQIYDWVEIGNYTYENVEDKIMIDESFREMEAFYPTSFCSPECYSNQAKKTLETDKCCWICVNCTYYEFLRTEDNCTDCGLGSLPNKFHNACVAIPEVFVRHGQPLTIGLSSFSFTGILVCFVVGLIFFKYRETPIIKASGKELSLILLFGVALSYGSTFAFLAEPNPMNCGAARFMLGLSYTVCYSAILTKTNRIARIFHGGDQGALKTKYTNPKSQIVILLVLSIIELIILIAWTTLEIPDITHLHPTRADNIRICSRSDDASYLIGLIYPFLLVGLCTVYAIKTRKTPDGFNEARFITFCAYSTCILWLSFIPVYFANSDHTLRVVTLALSLSVNSTVILVCIFLPKIYIAILRPNKNTREAVMARRSVSKSSEDTRQKRSDNLERGSSTNPAESEQPEIPPEPIVIISSEELGTPTNSHKSVSNASERQSDIQNHSIDSGCYVNHGFRDSRVFLDEGVVIDHVEIDIHAENHPQRHPPDSTTETAEKADIHAENHPQRYPPDITAERADTADIHAENHPQRHPPDITTETADKADIHTENHPQRHPPDITAETAHKADSAEQVES